MAHTLRTNGSEHQATGISK